MTRMSRDLTSDNLPLSRATSSEGPDAQSRFAVNCKDAGASDLPTPNSFAINCKGDDPSTDRFAVNCKDGLPPSVAAYIRQSLAENTKRAYASDIRQFEAVAGPLPATDMAVATYIAEQASRMKVSSLVRRLAALSKAHQLRGWPNPVRSILVRTTLRGIRRVHWGPRQQARALLGEDLATIVASMGHALRDTRDRALLLVGFAGGFRRSELVGIDAEDIEHVAEGIFVQLHRSKTDQFGAGRLVAIPRGPGGMCPVTALIEWLACSRTGEGAVFRSVDRRDRVGERLSGEAVGSILRRRVEWAGLDASGYSGHSLRAGLVTSAADRGVANEKIRQQTGHASVQSLSGYIRNPEEWKANAAAIALSAARPSEDRCPSTEVKPKRRLDLSMFRLGPIASFRGDAASQSLSEQSGHRSALAPRMVGRE